MEGIKDKFVTHIRALQKNICTALEEEDGGAVFGLDEWERPGGGGGITRILEKGKVFEKAGVNSSVVDGTITPNMRKQLGLEGEHFFATGLSLVLHPFNPYVPSVHANFRYFETYDGNGGQLNCWFGGGADLTPYYLFEEDAMHFHSTFKQTCDRFDPTFYPEFKKNCDEYFVNSHRNNETRGIGGIFYDRCTPTADFSATRWMECSVALAESFLPAYLPVVQKRKTVRFAPEQKYWQEIRRGRYVEFNLVHDKGTLFGLKTKGRIESILMSLPPTVRFDYNFQPEPGSDEEQLMKVCLQPREWI